MKDMPRPRTSPHTSRSKPWHGATIKTITTLVLLAQGLSQTSAFHFYLHADEKRCFTESAAPNTKILIEYTVSTGSGVMPVDLTVTMKKGAKSLVDRHGVEHGKVAFVLPFPELDELPPVYQAQAHRRNNAPIQPGFRHPFRNVRDMHDSMQQARPNPPHDRAATQENFRNAFKGRHLRRLLSVDDDHSSLAGAGTNAGAGGGARGFAPPQQPQQQQVDREAFQPGMRDVGPNYDSRHYEDLDDDMDDLDMDSYDGIREKMLEAQVAENARRHIDSGGTFDSASDTEKERQLFETRQFELCFMNSEHKNDAQRRRIKLVVHKGDAAHDYTRLAKNEDLSQLEVSLQHISAELHQLMRELDQSQQMESVLYRLNEGTNYRVSIMSVLSLLTLIGVAAYQASFTKRFFKRKKLL